MDSDPVPTSVAPLSGHMQGSRTTSTKGYRPPASGGTTIMSESMERHIDLADTSDAPGQARETATDFLADAERIRGEPTSPD